MGVRSVNALGVEHEEGPGSMAREYAELGHRV